METITQTFNSEIPPRPTVTSSDLNWWRWKIVIWGVALAAAGASMNFVFGIWGMDMFVVSATLALVFRDSQKMLNLAHRIIALDGLVVASAAIWLAFNTTILPTPWLVTIVVGCLFAIGYCLYCLFCLAKSNRQTMETLKNAAWTRAKKVIVVGVGVLLAAGTTAVVIREFSTPSIEEVFNHYWEGRYLKKAPPVVILRPSGGGISGVTSQDTGRMVARGAPLGALMSLAYGPPAMHFHWSENRVSFAPGITDGKFDFLLAVPNHPQAALQAEIKKQLGLVAHRETRDTDVLVLKVSNPSAIGLAVVNGGNRSDRTTERGGYEFTNEPINFLRDYLENALGKPVIDETELTQNYSGSLKWNPPSDKAAKLKEIQNALSDQFGLELVQRREPIEMLIVEKAQ